MFVHSTYQHENISISAILRDVQNHGVFSSSYFVEVKGDIFGRTGDPTMFAVIAEPAR